MNEQPDDKIQQLVRSVLEAVDARLSGVRAEMTSIADDLQHRQRQLLESIVSLQHRVDTIVQQPVVRPDEFAAGLAEVRASLAAMRAELTMTARATGSLPVTGAPQLHLQAPFAPMTHHTTEVPHLAPNPSPHLAPLPAAASAPTPAATAPELGTPESLGPDLSRVTKPIMADVRLTQQIPIVPMIERVTPEAEDAPAVAWVEQHADAQANDEMIDLERLTRLLSDKLEHLSLPVAD